MSNGYSSAVALGRRIMETLARVDSVTITHDQADGLGEEGVEEIVAYLRRRGVRVSRPDCDDGIAYVCSFAPEEEVQSDD